MSFTLLGILNAQAAGAGGAGAYDLLETTVLTSTASSISFTGLDAYTDYKHLQLRLSTKDGQSGGSTLRLHFNSDTSFSYSSHFLEGNSFSVNSSALTDNDFFFVSQNNPGYSSETNVFSANVVDILDFSSITKNTTVRSLSGTVADNDFLISITSGLYFKTNAIQSLTFTANGTFQTRSRFSLYGIKG